MMHCVCRWQSCFLFFLSIVGVIINNVEIVGLCVVLNIITIWVYYYFACRPMMMIVLYVWIIWDALLPPPLNNCIKVDGLVNIVGHNLDGNCESWIYIIQRCQIGKGIKGQIYLPEYEEGSRCCGDGSGRRAKRGGTGRGVRGSSPGNFWNLDCKCCNLSCSVASFVPVT